jgi:hypothetical protein
MKHTYRKWMILWALVLTGPALICTAMAQEETYRLEYKDIFGKLRRPGIDFNHEKHVVALDKQGCGACHHTPDPKTGQLVYIEGEETVCSDCHGAKPDDGTPALREAFHGSCNKCHRQMRKTYKDFKGPTTCGECHQPG